jgi:hypothetical protein
MRQKPKKLIVALSFAMAAIIPLFIFYIRPPVLIVTEQSFIELYGKERLHNESFFSSLALFRSVKTVAVANDAGDDIVPFAITEASIKPYCVIFPLRFTHSARLYSELNPDIPVVLLEGRYPGNENPAENALGADKSGYFIYKTDINDDFYMAGLAAAAIKPTESQKKDDSSPETDKNGKIIVFLERNMTQMKDVFLRGLYDRGVLPETVFFNSFSQYSEQSDLFCVVLAGIGSEFLDKKTGVPVISFTWLNPFLLPTDVVMVINDSPWAQARQAVRMVSAGERSGLIKSEFLILDRKKFDRDVVALIKKNKIKS